LQRLQASSNPVRYVPFRKTHDLEELGQQCVEHDATLRAVVDRAAPLTEYSRKFRYPGDTDQPDRAEADAAQETARYVYNAILRRLPPIAPR
jgi:HEPN domain